MNARILTAALMLMALHTPCPAAPAAPAEQAEAWHKESINGVGYYSMQQLASFYKLTPATAKKPGKVKSYRNSAFSLGLQANSREATISGYRVHLTNPVSQNAAGELLVSEADVVKLLDPILRPTYISERRDIQTVVIDPGHGGTDEGNKSPQLRESEYTLKLAKELAEALKKQGVKVVLTRNSNHNVSDTERVDTAKSASAALFISLHVNKGRSDTAGIETYTATPVIPGKRAMEGNRHDAANAALAFALHTHAVAATKAHDRACRRARYTLLNTLNCPAAMVMVGYSTNEQEATALTTDAYRAELIRGLCDGVMAFKNAIRPGAAITVPAYQQPEPAPTPVAKPKNTDAKPAKEDAKAKPKKSRPNNRSGRRRR